MEESIRLDKYLATLFPELSRTRIKNSIKSGNVLVNNSSAKPSYLLCVNDEIKFEFIVENEQQVHMESVEMELNILYIGPPGISYSFNKFRVNALDVSNWAKSFLGPTTFTTAFQSESATPFAKGFSGPIMAKVVPVS